MGFAYVDALHFGYVFSPNSTRRQIAANRKEKDGHDLNHDRLRNLFCYNIVAL